jgi:hypothetical protein
MYLICTWIWCTIQVQTILYVILLYDPRMHIIRQQAKKYTGLIIPKITYRLFIIPYLWHGFVNMTQICQGGVLWMLESFV